MKVGATGRPAAVGAGLLTGILPAVGGWLVDAAGAAAVNPEDVRAQARLSLRF